MVVCRLLTLMLLIIMCFSCTHRQKGLHHYKGSVSVNFTNDDFGYKWNFKRNYTDTLVEKMRAEFLDAHLSYVKTINDSTLGALDYKNGKIYFLSAGLDTQYSYVKPKDSSKEIMSFDFKDSELVLYDFTKRSPEKFTTISDSGSAVRFMKQRSYLIPDNASIYRVAYLDNGNFLYVHPLVNGSDLEFTILKTGSADSAGQKYSLAEILHTNKELKSPEMSYDGEFISNNESRFLVYMCRYAGYFMVFDKQNGEFLYDSQTIDKTPPPTASFVEIAPGVKHLEIKPNVMFFPSASVYMDKLYLLNFISKDHVTSIDIYDLTKKGLYTASYYLPDLDGEQSSESIAVQKDNLFVLYKKNVIVKYIIKNQ